MLHKRVDVNGKKPLNFSRQCLRPKKKYGQRNADCNETSSGVLKMSFLVGIISILFRDIPPWVD